jgi:hypothetical protein
MGHLDRMANWDAVQSSTTQDCRQSIRPGPSKLHVHGQPSPTDAHVSAALTHDLHAALLVPV